MKSPRTFTLPNGLRVVLAPQEGAPTATALVMVRAGSEDEKAEENGVSHFLEHLAFKGSTKYPKPGEISHALESLGADNNAWTTEHHTAYWAKSQAGKAQDILEIVTELHLHPLLEPGEVDKERGVILEELAMVEDDPQRKVMDLWQEALYGSQPAGLPVGGTKASVKAITHKQVVDYRSRRYRAPQTVVAMAGGFDAAAAAKFIKAKFQEVDARPAVRKPKTREEQQKPGMLVRAKKSDQAHLALGFRAFPMGDKREAALQVLAAVLGNGMSSRLFMRIREELGAAYYVYAGADLSLDHGSLAVGVGASLGKVDVVISAIMDEFTRLTRELVSPRELARAKDYQIGMFLMGMESSHAIATHHASDLLLRGRVVPIRETVAAVRAVTAEDIRRVARSVVREDRLNLAGIGPDLDPARLRKLLRLR